MKLPYSAGLLMVRTDSKLSKHIKFMSKYTNTSSSCETAFQWWSTSGSNRFEIFKTHRIHVKVSYSGGIYTSGSNRFESFETHRIYLKLPNSAGLLVVRTDSKLSKHIEFM